MKGFLKVLFIFLLALYVHAEPNFPKLTGRVVDNANILSSGTKAKLNTMLSNLENNSSNQLVVVTLPSLQGYDIADFGYKLGRYWGIGQKKKNNGVLLIIAPNERKVRIEVGYGLEGVLTDAVSSIIIQNKILPYFKKSNFNQGTIEGAKAIIGTINGTYKPQIKKSKRLNPLFPQIFFGFFFLIMIMLKVVPKKYRGIIEKMVPSSFFGLFGYIASSSILIGLGVWVFIFFILLFFKAFNQSVDGSNPSWYSSNDSFSDNNDFGGGFGGGGFSGSGGGFGGGGSSGSW